MSETNWKQIIDQAKSGSQQASSELVSLAEKKLYKFCFLLSGNRELAEDLCQETLIKALTNLNQLKTPEAFLGWLYQTARHQFLDLKKSASQREVPMEEPLEGQSTEPEIETTLRVQKVLSHFEPDDRFLLLLIELEGYSYAEAAKSIQTTEDAVRSKIHRLRQEFLKIIKKSETN